MSRIKYFFKRYCFFTLKTLDLKLQESLLQDIFWEKKYKIEGKRELEKNS